MTASIIVINYNYGRYLSYAIESALTQSAKDVEVIVVDDGSTDGSVDIVRRYGSRVTPILKANGGQGSAINAGFRASSGDVVLFLDSDDVLYQSAVSEVLPVFERDETLVRVQWRMDVIDIHGRPAAQDSKWVRENKQKRPLDEGDMSSHVLAGGPFTYKWTPTSGNVWSRRFLSDCPPIPEAPFWNTAEIFLSALCPLYGPIRALDHPLSAWRDHRDNFTALQRKHDFERELAWGVERFDACLEAMLEIAPRRGYVLDRSVWLANSWFHRVQRAAQTIRDTVPRGESIILADQDSWATDGRIDNRLCFPFVGEDGVFRGVPSTETAAVDEIRALRAQGVRYFCLTWVVGDWVLDSLPGFAQYLRSQKTLARTADMTIFEIG